MARIEEFEAKDVKLTPSDKGYAAVEMAARRIGPLYGQMAAGQRELGNLTKGSDEAIGRAAEAFLRFQGLSQQSSGIGVKVGKGGAAERTLLGTGAGGDTSWNARANASNDLTERGARTAAGTATGQTADQAAAAAVGITLPLTPAQQKAAATAKTAADKDVAALKAAQVADQLKADRAAEDKQIAAAQATEDHTRAMQRNEADTKDGKIISPTDAATINARAEEDFAVKRDRAQAASDLQQKRLAQDAAVREGRLADVYSKAQLNWQDKLGVNRNAKLLVDAANGTVKDLNQTATTQTVIGDYGALMGPTLKGSVAGVRNNGLRIPGSNTGEAADTENPSTGNDASSLSMGMGMDTMPTFLGDAPAITPSRQYSNAGAAAGQTGGEAPPPPENPENPYVSQTPSSAQVIQSPIDQPGDVPGLYSDMTGGM